MIDFLLISFLFFHCFQYVESYFPFYLLLTTKSQIFFGSTFSSADLCGISVGLDVRAILFTPRLEFVWVKFSLLLLFLPLCEVVPSSLIPSFRDNLRSHIGIFFFHSFLYVVLEFLTILIIWKSTTLIYLGTFQQSPKIGSFQNHQTMRMKMKMWKLKDWRSESWWVASVVKR